MYKHIMFSVYVLPILEALPALLVRSKRLSPLAARGGAGWCIEAIVLLWRLAHSQWGGVVAGQAPAQRAVAPRPSRS